MSPILNRQFSTLWTILKYFFDYNIFLKVKALCPQVGSWVISKKGQKSITLNVHCTLYRHNPILCRTGFNFDGAARLFTVPGLSEA